VPELRFFDDMNRTFPLGEALAKLL
jgi:hypothetical protein